MPLHPDGDSYGAEPQTSDGDDESGMDLMARARLLCQAANEIALPMLQSVCQLKNQLEKKESKSRASSSKSQLQQKGDSRRERSEEDERDGEARRDALKTKKTKSTKPNHTEATTLPTLVVPKPLTKKQIPAQAKVTKKNKETDEAETSMPLPQINASEEWRKQREVEKIRQAQERAKARLLKSKHVEPLQSKSNQHPDSHEVKEGEAGAGDSEETLHQIEAHQRRARERIRKHKQEQALLALQAEEKEQVKKRTEEAADEEQKKIVEASRRRAEERLRLKKERKTGAQHQDDESAKKDASVDANTFRHRTLKRLQAAKRSTHAQENEDRPESTGSAANESRPVKDADEESAERERKRMERRRRRETAERLKRLQQLSQEQQRTEKELYEKGLNDFKAKRQEADRVAKGLQPKRAPEDPLPPVVFDEPATENDVLETTQAAKPEPARCHGDVEGDADSISSTEQDEQPNEQLNEQLAIVVDPHSEDRVESASSSGTKTRKKKLPPWKKPPVPILPAESYSQKALVSPSDSYAERYQFRTGRTSPQSNKVN